MTQELSAEARKRLDDHLDAVEKVLTDAGRTREQRRAVLDDLESQILDMLATRTAKPVLADVEAVLGEIDPPSAYAEPRPDGNIEATAPSELKAPARPARLSRVALWGFICIIASLVGFALQLLGLALCYTSTKDVHGQGPHHGIAMWGPFVLWLLIIMAGPGFGLVGTILGWIGFVQIRGSKGDLRGSGRALFAGLFYPTLFIPILLVLAFTSLAGNH
jgi:hypothetical protein